MPLSTEFQ